MGNKGGKQGDLVKFYEIKEKLGSGSFATVHRARRKADGQYFAVKTILKNKLDEEALENLRYEVEIMAKIDHPNVVRFIEMFETPKKLHLVMELLTGGELFDRITEKKTFSEKEAAEVIRAVTHAMSYLHSIGITHRDLKPENLIYATPADNAPIKVIDFGLANFRPYRHTLMITPCGTPGYVAPEVLKGENYTPQVDLWSIGVILYVLLCGYPPFYSKCVKKLYRKIMAGDYSFPSPHWDDVSDSAKDLIRGLMTVEPKSRLTCEKVLQHPWISGASSKPLSESRSQLLRLLQARRRLRKVVHKLIAIQKIKFLIEMVDEDSSPPSLDSSDSVPPLLTIVVDLQETNTITPRHTSTTSYFSESQTPVIQVIPSPSLRPSPESHVHGESTLTTTSPLSLTTVSPTLSLTTTPMSTLTPLSSLNALSPSASSEICATPCVSRFPLNHPQSLCSPPPTRASILPPSGAPSPSPSPSPITIKIHRKGGSRRASSPTTSYASKIGKLAVRRSSSPRARKGRRPTRPPPPPPPPQIETELKLTPSVSKKEEPKSDPVSTPLPALETSFSHSQLDLLLLQPSDSGTVSLVQQTSPVPVAQNSPSSRFYLSTTDSSVSQSDGSTLSMSPVCSIPPMVLFPNSPTLPPPLVSRFDDSEPNSPIDRPPLPQVLEVDESQQSPYQRDDSLGDINTFVKNDLKARTPHMVGSLLVLR